MPEPSLYLALCATRVATATVAATPTATNAAAFIHAFTAAPNTTSTLGVATVASVALAVGTTLVVPCTTCAGWPDGSGTGGSTVLGSVARAPSEVGGGLSGGMGGGRRPVVLALCDGSHSAMHARRICCLRTLVTRSAQPPVVRHMLLPAAASASRASLCSK